MVTSRCAPRCRSAPRIDAHVHDQLPKHIDIVDVRFQQTKIIRVNREEERRIACCHRYGKDDEQSKPNGTANASFAAQ